MYNNLKFPKTLLRSGASGRWAEHWTVWLVLISCLKNWWTSPFLALKNIHVHPHPFLKIFSHPPFLAHHTAIARKLYWAATCPSVLGPCVPPIHHCHSKESALNSWHHLFCASVQYLPAVFAIIRVHCVRDCGQWQQSHINTFVQCKISGADGGGCWVLKESLEWRSIYTKVAFRASRAHIDKATETRTRCLALLTVTQPSKVYHV